MSNISARTKALVDRILVGMGMRRGADRRGMTYLYVLNPKLHGSKALTVHEVTLRPAFVELPAFGHAFDKYCASLKPNTRIAREDVKHAIGAILELMAEGTGATSVVRDAQAIDPPMGASGPTKGGDA